MAVNPTTPAFPRPCTATDSGTTGISTRTYLAGLAIQGLASNKGIIDTLDGETQVAAFAVELADALIAALNQPTT